MQSEIPPLLRALHERFRFRITGPRKVARFDAFTIDLADWKLSLTNRNPCLWIHTPELLTLPTADLADEITDAAREQGWLSETTLILFEGNGKELRQQLALAYDPFLVVDAAQQKEIVNASAPRRALVDLLLTQIPRSELAPYETNRPVTGNRFFGRDREIKELLKSQDNYLLIGFRRVGKTSLLKELQRRMDERDLTAADETRRVYVDCAVITTAEELYTEIVSRLSPADLKRILGRQSKRYQRQMFENLADLHRGQITYLLDEIDPLLENESQAKEFWDALRSASSADKNVARFIMAGYRQARRARNDPDHHIYNVCKSYPLGALPLGEVRDMIEKPMADLRVHLEMRDELVRQIYYETAGLPNLVQFYCYTLLQRLDRGDIQGDTIRLEHLRVVYDSPEMRDYMLESFMANSEPIERALVAAMASSPAFGIRGEPFTLANIAAEMRRRHLSLKLPVLDGACRDLVNGGFLSPERDTYRFTIPVFARLIRENYSVDAFLQDLRNEYTHRPEPRRGRAA